MSTADCVSSPCFFLFKTGAKNRFRDKTCRVVLLCYTLFPDFVIVSPKNLRQIV